MLTPPTSASATEPDLAPGGVGGRAWRPQTASARTEQLNIGGGRAVTRRENWLVACEGISGIADAVEASPVPFEYADEGERA